MLDKPLGKIIWPEDNLSAEKLWISFALRAIENLNLESELPQTAVDTARHFLDSGSIPKSANILKSEIWSGIQTSGVWRDFSDRHNLLSRIGLSIIPDTMGSERSEKLEWFLEFLSDLGCDTSSAEREIETHFTFPE